MVCGELRMTEVIDEQVRNGREIVLRKKERKKTPPPLECNSILPLVTAVLITTKGAEPPGSRRIGVIGALVLIFPSETV